MVPHRGRTPVGARPLPRRVGQGLRYAHRRLGHRAGEAELQAVEVSKSIGVVDQQLVEWFLVAKRVWQPQNLE
ncbi:MAG: hypothetical protein AAF602_33385, partial [Myxococcota bacterium]